MVQMLTAPQLDRAGSGCETRCPLWVLAATSTFEVVRRQPGLVDLRPRFEDVDVLARIVVDAVARCGASYAIFEKSGDAYVQFHFFEEMRFEVRRVSLGSRGVAIDRWLREHGMHEPNTEAGPNPWRDLPLGARFEPVLAELTHRAIVDVLELGNARTVSVQLAHHDELHEASTPPGTCTRMGEAK